MRKEQKHAVNEEDLLGTWKGFSKRGKERERGREKEEREKEKGSVMEQCRLKLITLEIDGK